MDANTLLHSGHIDLWLLLVGLVFPRLALFVAWLFIGDYPPNSLSMPVNVLSWIFFPRFLMAYYIYVNVGPNNLWFWAYIILGIVGIFGESGFMSRRVVRRRTTVTRDGNSTTTVEEEEV